MKLLRKPKEPYNVPLWGFLEIRGLTQAKFAEAIGVAPATVNTWMYCRASPNYCQIEKIMDVYCVDSDAVMDLFRYVAHFPCAPNTAQAI